MVVGHVKDWLEQAITNGKSGIVTPVIVVAGQTYRIDTTTASLYNWRRRLCASAETSTALRAPSWDPKSHKARGQKSYNGRQNYGFCHFLGPPL